MLAILSAFGAGLILGALYGGIVNDLLTRIARDEEYRRHQGHGNG